jgi:MFS family permease
VSIGPAFAAARRRLGPFGQGPFAVYWTGGFVSNVGTWLQAVSGSVFVYDRTGSAFAVGVLNFATFLPVLLFSVIGGVLSDRFDRRAVIVVTHAISATLGVVLALMTFGGVTTEVHLVAIAFALQTSAAIAKPCFTAMLPNLVSRAQLAEAVGLNTLQFMTAQLAGPVLATVLLATAGFAWAFTINALTFIAPIIAMTYLFRRGLGGAAPRQDERAASATPQGVAGYIRSQPWIAWLLLGIVANSAVLEVIRTTAPVLVTQRLGAPSSDTGLIVAAQSLGYILGLLAFIPLRRRELGRPLAALGFVCQAGGLLLVSLATAPIIAGVGVALVGAGFSLAFPVMTATLQAEVPDAVRGRLMSIHQIAHLGNRPFAAFAAGSLAAAFGVPAACLAAMILAPIGLLAMRSAWRRLDLTAGPVSAAAASV